MHTSPALAGGRERTNIGGRGQDTVSFRVVHWEYEWVRFRLCICVVNKKSQRGCANPSICLRSCGSKKEKRMEQRRFIQHQSSVRAHAAPAQNASGFCFHTTCHRTYGTERNARKVDGTRRLSERSTTEQWALHSTDARENGQDIRLPFLSVPAEREGKAITSHLKQRSRL